MSKPLRIGWVGCGTHAREMLLPQISRLDAQLTALCDIDPSSLALAGQRHGVSPSNQHADWRALLERSDLDAVGLSIGPAQHFEIGMAAIERGLSLYIEKPPAPTSLAARQLAEAARKKGVPVLLGFMKRYSTANRIAINVVRRPDFGATASFLGEYMTAPTYFARDPDYSGFYLHHCVHYFDLVPHLMGGVASLSARRHEIAPGKLLLHVHFTFKSGGLGTLVMGTHQSRGTPMEWWQVMGDHTRVEVRNVHEVRYVRAPPFKVGKPDASLIDTEDTLVWEPNLTVAANEDHKGYHALLEDFVAVAKGEKRGYPSLEDGARAMELLELTILAARTGETLSPSSL